MSVSFLTSWRFALIGAGVITLCVALWNSAFGPDTATRIAEARMAALFPGGEASDTLLDRPIVIGPPWTDLRFTLRETVALFADATVTYEPINAQVFITRLATTNVMTLEPLEFAFRFVAVDGPEGFGTNVGFTGPSLVLDHTAVNRVEATPAEGWQIMGDIRMQVLAMRAGAR